MQAHNAFAYLQAPRYALLPTPPPPPAPPTLMPTTLLPPTLHALGPSQLLPPPTRLMLPAVPPIWQWTFLPATVTTPQPALFTPRNVPSSLQCGAFNDAESIHAAYMLFRTRALVRDAVLGTVLHPQCQEAYRVLQLRSSGVQWTAVEFTAFDARAVATYGAVRVDGVPKARKADARKTLLSFSSFRVLPYIHIPRASGTLYPSPYPPHCYGLWHHH